VEREVGSRGSIRRLARHGAAGALLALLACASPPPAPEPQSAFDAAETRAAQLFVEISRSREDRGDLPGALRASEKGLAQQPGSRLAQLRRIEVITLIGEHDDSPEALSQARALLGAIPESDEPEARYVRARLDLAEGRSEPAASALAELVEAQPEEPRYRRALGLALWARGDTAGAQRELDAVVEAAPRLEAARADRARLELATGRPAEAAADASAVVRASRDDPERRLVLAQAYALLGRTSDAIDVLHAVPPDARSVDAQILLARLELRVDRGDEARAQLERANGQQPNDPRVLELWLEVDRSSGDVQPSLDRTEAALAERPDDAQLLQVRALALAAAGRDEEAAASFRRAFQIDPADPAGYERLRRYLDEGDPASAPARAVEIAGDTAEAHYLAAQLYGLRSDPRAQDELGRTLELDPDNAHAENDLAWELAQRGGDLDRALSLARAAHASLWYSPDVADTLGVVLVARGDHAEAVEVLRQAVEAYPEGDPRRAQTRYHLARALAGSGDRAEARKELHTALGAAEKLKLKDAWVQAARSLSDDLGEEKS
jgi:tetratricopeptide (TPR) repeat protein